MEVMRAAKKIRVLIVDDSALIRRMLTEILDADPEIEVVGAARDPLIARDKIKLLNPDVLTLDVEMPRMDGLQFLKNLMRLRPMPVVMVSTLTREGASVTLEALELGAVDFVSKPVQMTEGGLQAYAGEIIDKVKAASQARIQRSPSAALEQRGQATTRLPPVAALTADAQRRCANRLIAIGASTGGTEAIKVVLEGLPENMPPVVIVQHIPAAFSAPFARRLNQHCAINVCEAENGQLILPGHAYIAPGDQHLCVERGDGAYFCRLSDREPVNRHKPSVDILMESVARTVGREALGVMLTGMGRDGAAGLKMVREAGATTVAQDEASSVVWGMPGAAVKNDAVDWILPLNKIAEKLLALCSAQQEVQHRRA